MQLNHREELLVVLAEKGEFVIAAEVLEHEFSARGARLCGQGLDVGDDAGKSQLLRFAFLLLYKFFETVGPVDPEEDFTDEMIGNSIVSLVLCSRVEYAEFLRTSIHCLS